MDYGSRRVIIIEDFDEMRKNIRRMLESFGVKQIEEAANGEQAMALLSASRFNLVICDYNLGQGKNGQQILEEAKHRGLLNHSAVFMMITAETSMDMVLGAVEHKPDDYLSKPFSRSSLRLRLDRLLQKKADNSEIDKAREEQDHTLVVSLCDSRLAKAPKDRHELLKTKIGALFDLGRHDEAREICEGLLAERQIQWARLELGKAHYHLGNLHEAKQIFGDLIAENRLLMEAYDWQALTLRQLGKEKEAQSLLDTAAGLSPNSLQRRKTLGELAFGNKDYETADRSFSAVVKLGKHSILRKADDYSLLAKAKTAKGEPAEALKVLQEARTEYADDKAVAQESLLMESAVLHKMGKAGEARKALETALKMNGETKSISSADASLKVAKMLFEVGDEEQALDLMKNVVHSNHEDKAVLAQVQGAFSEMDMEDEGKQIITTTSDEMVQLNNRGVQLARDGSLTESIKLFEEAARGLPDSKTINLNAAQVLIMYMDQKGAAEHLVNKAGDYLARVEAITPDDEKLNKLQAAHKRLTRKA